MFRYVATETGTLIFCNFLLFYDLKKQLKLLAMAFDQFLTCLILPL